MMRVINLNLEVHCREPGLMSQADFDYLVETTRKMLHAIAFGPEGPEERRHLWNEEYRRLERIWINGSVSRHDRPDRGT